MRILYVEDKPSENIDRIIFLFEKYLNKDIVKQLKDLKDDESNYGVSAEEIKQIINSSNSIWFEYNFYQALKVLNSEQNKFVLFIIDRNLSDSDYDVEEIQKIEPNYSEEMSVNFLGFEGDYLLHKLLYENVDVNNKFFFLTANSSDSLKNLEDIQKHIEWGKFSSDNFIDKTDNRQKEKLRNVINGHQQMQVQLENSEYLEILQKYVGEKTVDEFMKLMIDKDLQIPDALVSCRKLLESILTILAETIKPTNSECWRYKKGKKELKLSTFINHVTNEEIVYYSSNTIVEMALKNIKTISSEFGAHQDLKSDKMLATNNTVQSLIYNLKDIILWFGDVLK